MVRLIVSIIKQLIFWMIAVCGALAVSAFALPVVFYAIERVRDVPLPYEAVVRLSLLYAHGLMLAVSAWILTRGGSKRGWCVWWGFFISYLSLAIIFFGDTNSRLMDEYSWIRYTTSVFLFAAGALALIQSRSVQIARTVRVVWIALALAFIFAGLDELAQLHEAVGVWLSSLARNNLPTGDFVTLLYALGGIIFIAAVLYFGKTYLQEIIQDKWSVTLLSLGAITYLFSTLFDTVDFALLGALQRLVANLVANNQFVIGDAWALIWTPRNFFNNLEEVLEHTAALLFVLAIFIRIYGKMFELTQTDAQDNSKPHNIQCPLIHNMVAYLCTIVIVVSGALIVASLPYTFPSSPLIEKSVPRRIAGKAEGLLHADDLTYHPNWGVLIGNENRGTVLMWRNNALAKLNDPAGILSQVEAITVDDDFVYAVDGARGIIAQYSARDAQWKILWSRADGLHEPEGIAVDPRTHTLYVLDESENSVMRLVIGRKPEVWKPQHNLWKAPEGIEFDQTRGMLIITDDASGAVFEANFDASLKLIARLSKAEDIAHAQDGTLYVTDNGWGAVFAIAPDGSVLRTTRFLRAYRDLQGVAAYTDDELYVTVSDGYNSGSIMPSQVFKLRL